MSRWGSLATAMARMTAIVAVAAAADAWAQTCESMTGRARTDCFIGRARISGQTSGIAAGAARQRTDEEYLRAATGTSVAPKPPHAKGGDRIYHRPRN
jgi:hypothetical protein